MRTRDFKEWIFSSFSCQMVVFFTPMLSRCVVGKTDDRDFSICTHCNLHSQWGSRQISIPLHCIPDGMGFPLRDTDGMGLPLRERLHRCGNSAFTTAITEEDTKKSLWRMRLTRLEGLSRAHTHDLIDRSIYKRICWVPPR